MSMRLVSITLVVVALVAGSCGGDDDSGTQESGDVTMTWVHPGEGPYRYMMWSKTTGRVYYLKSDYGPLRRYDPETNTATVIDAKIGMRSATLETPKGYIYAVANGNDGRIYRFDVKKEKVKESLP